MPKLSEPQGVFQGDVVVRSALVAAIADLRSQPWLLDYVFSSLLTDTLTASEYGQKEVDQARKWFQKTDIPVLLNVRVPDDAAPPKYCVTLSLMGSDEGENTTSDTHYEPFEASEADWHVLSAKFNGTYNSISGTMTIPSAITDELVLATGMVIMDKYGTTYPVLEVLSTNIIQLATKIVTDFSVSYIKSAKPSQVTAIESASFKESYVIGCHAKGEPVHLTYLHSIIVFCLLRYRQALLEARGLERTQISSTDFRPEGEGSDLYFSRYVSLTGSVRQSWPQNPKTRILTLDATRLQVIGGNKVPSEAGAPDTGELAWVGDQDSLTYKP